MQNYHSGLPSAHDVVTGFWTPSEAEAEAGLTGPHDFCTLAAIIGTNYGMMMKERADKYSYDGDTSMPSVASMASYTWAELTAYSGITADGWEDSVDFINDGSLGWAAYQMAITFGLDVEDEDYDLTCSHAVPWPEPAADSYQNLYLEVACPTRELAAPVTEPCYAFDVPHHTIYNYFVEGDYKRAMIDAEMWTTAMTLK